jgi:hypothetical protein
VTEVTSHQGTHTYRLSKLLKINLCCAKPLSPSAAQKRDYEPLPYFRQAFQKLFFPENLTSSCLYYPTVNRRFRLPLQVRGAFYGFHRRRQYLFENCFDQATKHYLLDDQNLRLLSSRASRPSILPLTTYPHTNKGNREVYCQLIRP